MDEDGWFDQPAPKHRFAVSMEAYKTRWNRMYSSIADGLIMSVCAMFFVVITAGVLSAFGADTSARRLPGAITPFAYIVMLQAKWGHTVAERQSWMRVVRCDTFGPPGWRRLTLRVLPYALLYAFGVLLFPPDRLTFNIGSPMPPGSAAVPLITLGIADALSTFLDPRRRTLTEILSGTVLVHERYLFAPRREPVRSEVPVAQADWAPGAHQAPARPSIDRS